MEIKSIVDLFYFIQSNNSRPDLLNYRAGNSWVPISTELFIENVKKLSAGLRALGVQKNDNIGIISNPSPFWVMSDFSIMLSGAITVPIFRRISPENLTFEIENSELDYIFIGDQNEYEPVRQYGKRIRKIITIGFEKNDSLAVSFDQLMKLGADYLESNGNPASDGNLTGNDLATIIYTSGSMGIPKGVMLTHENLLSQVFSANILFPIDKNTDIAMSSLPLSHIFERMVMYYYLYNGLPVYFVDDLANIGVLIKDVRPTIMTVVPRLLEKIFAKMKSSIEAESGIKKVIGKAAFKRAQEKNENEPYRGILDFIYQKLVYSKLSGALGGRFRCVISGSASLPEDIGRFFLNIGLPLYEGYGLTEASPVIAANYPGHRKLGTVGPAFPSIQIKIDGSDSEILIKGPNVMRGYLKNPVETARALDSDGYLHTGDMGSLDDEGYLSIIGRKKELFKKSTGEYVPPIPIEQALMKLDVVDTAMVIAEGRKFVSCLIFPNLEVAEKLKEKNGFSQMKLEEFLDGNYIHDLVQNHILEMNKHLHHTEEVQKFAIIKTPISIETGEITPTMKIVRRIIEEKFKKEIDSMYRE